MLKALKTHAPILVALLLTTLVLTPQSTWRTVSSVSMKTALLDLGLNQGKGMTEGVDELGPEQNEANRAPESPVKSSSSEGVNLIDAQEVEAHYLLGVCKTSCTELCSSRMIQQCINADQGFRLNERSNGQCEIYCKW